MKIKVFKKFILCLFLSFITLIPSAQAVRSKAVDISFDGANLFNKEVLSDGTVRITSDIPRRLGVSSTNVLAEYYAGYSSAGDLLDMSGNVRNLADTGAPPVVDSNVLGSNRNALQAFSYNGSSQFHSLAHDAWMNVFDGDFSLTFVLKTPSSSPAGTIVYFSHGATNTDGIYAAIANDGTIKAYLNKAGALKAVSTASSFCDGLYHIVQVVRNGDTLTLYVDGISYSVATGCNDGYGLDGNHILYVGAYDGGILYYPQHIAYTRLQDSALTYAQIQREVDLFKGTLGSKSAQSYVTPTFTRSTTSYVNKSTGTTSMHQVPANWPVKTADGGILVEGSVTQLLTYTGAFSTNWTKSNSSIAATSVVLPDGTTGTTNTLYETYVTPENTHYLEQAYSATSGSTYCYSIYVKYNGSAATPREWIRLMVSDSVNYYRRYFNIRYGYVGSTDGALTGGYGIKSVGNGWFRIHIYATAGATSASSLARIYIAEGDGDVTFEGVNPGQDSYFIAFPQLQTGAFPTTYYPRLDATAASRSADSLTYIPWRITKNLAQHVAATPRLQFLGSESLNSTTVTPTIANPGPYAFTKNGRPQNGNNTEEGAHFIFNGSTDYLSLPDASGGSDFDFSAVGQKFSVVISYTPSIITGSTALISKWLTTGNKRQWMVYTLNNDVYAYVSKDGTSVTQISINVLDCLEIGKPVLITFTYDGTNGDNASQMRLYVDAATDTSPDYIASSDIARAPIYNSDTDFLIGKQDTAYTNGKILYTAIYDAYAISLSEHQAMYSAFKLGGILPLVLSSTSAKTKLLIEFEAKTLFATSIPTGAELAFISIGGTTGESTTSKNSIVISVTNSTLKTNHRGSDGVSRSFQSDAKSTWNSWHKYTSYIDLVELSNSTHRIDSVDEKDSTSGNVSGANSINLIDALIRVVQIVNSTVNNYCEIRNVKISTQ